jgi:hypothetical protein
VPGRIQSTLFPDNLYYRSRSFAYPKDFLAEDPEILAPHKKVRHVSRSFVAIQDLTARLSNDYTTREPLVPAYAWLLVNIPKCSLHTNNIREESFCFYYIVSFKLLEYDIVGDHRISRQEFVEEHVLWSVDLTQHPAPEIAGFLYKYPHIFQSVRLRFRSLFPQFQI